MTEAATMIDLDQLIRSASDLAPLPVTVPRLATLVADENSDIGEISEAISLDQALTARLLRWANSSASTPDEPITSVSQAVMRMGTGMILEIAMAASVSRELKQAVPAYGLSEGELWRHSIAAALAVDGLKRRGSVSVPQECFATALLHDVGKLVMSRYLDPGVLRLLRKAQDVNGLSERRAELDVLQVHHGEIGGLVAQHWKLPDSIVHGIIYHHSPEEIDDPSSYVIQMANIVAKTIGTGGGIESIDSEERRSALDYLSLSEEDLESVCTDVNERLQTVLNQYA